MLFRSQLYRRKNPNQTLISNLQGFPEALSAYLLPFFVSSTRDTATSPFGYLRGLFQSGRANMLRMSEVNDVDHQAMQHMLTEGCVNWDSLGEKARLWLALHDSGIAGWANPRGTRVRQQQPKHRVGVLD